MASQSDKGRGDAPQAAPSGGWPGFLERVFSRKVTLAGLVFAVLLIWAAAKLNVEPYQTIFAVAACVVLLVTLVTFVWPLIWRRGQSKKPLPALRRRFRTKTFQPDRWRVILRLSGPGVFIADGFINFSEPVDGKRSYHYHYLESFLAGLAGKDKYNSNIDRTVHHHVKVRTKNKETDEIYEQARVTFWWDAATCGPPQHAEIEVGRQMPADRREALLERLAEELTNLPGVETEKASST